MKKIITKMVPLALCFVMLFSNLDVYALSKTEQREVDGYAEDIELTMELILEMYAAGEITAEQLYQGAMTGLTIPLDEYSMYFTPEENKKFEEFMSGYLYGIGITYAPNEEGFLEIIDVLVDSPADVSGVKPGDIIYKYNGTDVTGMSVDEVILLMSDDSVRNVTLEVKRGEEFIQFDITKEELNVESIIVKDIEEILPKAEGNNNDNIGYIQMTQVGDNTFTEFDAAMKQFQKEGKTDIILDLRGNPGGRMDVATEICNSIVPAGPIFTVRDNKGEEFTAVSTLEKVPYEQMVVLVDENTASAAELITSALQDSGAATVVGVTTYGKGVVQSKYELDHGDSIKFTTMEYFSRNGNKINGVGIIPDVVADIPAYTTEALVNLDANHASETVIEIKQILQYLGYETGAINTVYDEKTEESIKQFQKDYGYTVDGKLNYETVLGLNIALYQAIQEKDPILNAGYDEIMK